MTQSFVLPALCVLPVVVFCALFFVPEADAELHFNINALNLSEEQKKQMDLSLLSRTDIQMPGEYEVTVRVNRSDAGKYRLSFTECDGTLCPELPLSILRDAGVKVATIPGLKNLDADATITRPGDHIPDAEVQFDFEHAALNLSIPQAAMDINARGYIPPAQWDDGLPVLFTSGSASGAETRNRLTGKQESSQYVNLRSGVNAGPWRLRNISYFQHASSGSELTPLQSWIERDIRSLSARLVAGETSSPGLIFDSFSFRGISLSTREDMLPDSMQGYAPQITGVAITNATVEVRQNGNLLYQTFVTPGKFVINDLYATSTSGDFYITVREEDATVRTWTQSFASPPVSVRQGALKYSLTAGEFGSRYYNLTGTVAQRFVQSEFLYGLINNTSLYAGLIAAEHYRSGMLGVGQGLGVLGAVSLNGTHAETHFDTGEKQAGQSWNVRYSKYFESTGTSMTLAGYRYATDGYYDFDEASNSFHTQDRRNRTALKNRIQLNLNQNTGRLGSVSLSANQLEFWGARDTRTRSISGSWSRTFGGVVVSLNQSQNRSWRTEKTDNVTSASVSLPLGKWFSGNSSSVRMNNSFTHSDTGSTMLNSTLSGTGPEGNNLSWSVSQAYSKQASGQTGSSTALSGTYRGGLTTLSMGYSDYYGESQRFNWGVQGAVVVHPYGVTLSPPLSEGSSYALVRAPGAGNVKVKNRTGLTTDARGYAVVPSMMAYRENAVSLDTASLGENVDLSEPVKKVVPAREALVLADYDTRVGYRTLLTLRHGQQLVPFGSTVSAGESQGIVDDNGQVYLSGVTGKPELAVLLPGGRRCYGVFDVSKAVKRNGLMMTEAECR